MKLEEIYWKQILEQLEGNEENEENSEDGNEVDGEVRRPAKINPIKVLKNRWKTENPTLSDSEIDDAIESFKRLKDRLRPIHTPPAGGDMPELVALKLRFPHFPTNDIQKIKDIQTYKFEELTFLFERFDSAEAIRQLDYSLVGETPEDKMRSALEKWKNPSTLIINQPPIIVHKIRSKNDAMALGRLQHLVIAKWMKDHPMDSWNKWCITLTPEDNNTNLYTSYRDSRSYYFILDLSRTNSTVKSEYIYHVSVIQPVNQEYRYREGPFIITNASNIYNTEIGNATWDRITSIWPQLAGKENLFTYFGQTAQEADSLTLDRISLIPGAENFLGNLHPTIQKRYIESNRNINNPLAFLTLSRALQTEYVKRTNRDNYETRFLPRHGSDNPFEMLLALTNSDLKTLHSAILIDQCGFPEGINRIKTVILQYRYYVFGREKDSNIFSFMDKSNRNVYGVIDLSTYKWIKEVKYVRQKYGLYAGPEGAFSLITYVKPDGSDEFGWWFSINVYPKKLPPGENSYIGEFLPSSEAIENKIKNYRQLK